METYLLLISIPIAGLLLFLSIYFIITLSDLECDYINANECCTRLNVWIIPRIFGQLLLLVLYAAAKRWYLLIYNFPFTFWILYQWYSVPKGSLGVYDATDIYNRGQIQKSIRNCFIVVGWYLSSLFINMYCSVLSILKGNPLEDVESIVNSTI